MEEDTRKAWLGVRCLFECLDPASTDEVGDDDRLYEERVTIWHARSREEAVALAQAEADAYAARIGDVYVGLSQVYRMQEPPAHGSEAFSLLRASRLERPDYLRGFFDTGAEIQADGECCAPHGK